MRPIERIFIARHVAASRRSGCARPRGERALARPSARAGRRAAKACIVLAQRRAEPHRHLRSQARHAAGGPFKAIQTRAPGMHALRAPAAPRRAGAPDRRRARHDEHARATTIARATSCTPATRPTRPSPTPRSARWVRARARRRRRAELPGLRQHRRAERGGGLPRRAERARSSCQNAGAAARERRTTRAASTTARFDRRRAALDVARGRASPRETGDRQGRRRAAPVYAQGGAPDALAAARGLRPRRRARRRRARPTATPTSGAAA